MEGTTELCAKGLVFGSALATSGYLLFSLHFSAEISSGPVKYVLSKFPWRPRNHSPPKRLFGLLPVFRTPG